MHFWKGSFELYEVYARKLARLYVLHLFHLVYIKGMFGLMFAPQSGYSP